MSEGAEIPEGLERQKPSRFERSTRLHAEIFINPPTVEGLEHLAEIPKDSGFVVASSHLSEVDTQVIASYLARYRKMSIASQSITQRILVIGGFMQWLTEGNLYDVSGGTNPKTKAPEFRFNPADFKAMETPIKAGGGMVVAAHQPVHDWKLPDRPGIGAVLLAQLTKTSVLPAVLDIDNESLPADMVTKVNEYPNAFKRLLTRRRPNSTLRYGQPVNLEPIDRNELENFMKVFSRVDVKSLSVEQRELALQTSQKLRLQGEQILRILASMLPPEKRGKW